MIELRNIHKIYSAKQGSVEALTGINLTVQAGEIFGVIGRSGAGKSTLIRCVNLLERPTSGSVIINQQDLMLLNKQALRKARRSIGMIFQHFNLLTTRTVYQNIAFPLQLIKKSKTDIEKIVMPLLELTGLKARRHAYPSQLSGGQKQRVAIARALALQPKVLLCDEMTSSLDPETTASILALIKSINEQMQLSILLITHEMDVIKKIADHVAVIENGRIIECANVVDLFKHPKTNTARSFVRSAMQPELPRVLTEKISDQPSANCYSILQIAFTGSVAGEPIIDALMKQFSVRINILQANLEYLRHDTIGMMLISLTGEAAERSRAEAFLTEQGLEIEVLGYVQPDDWIIN